MHEAEKNEMFTEKDLPEFPIDILNVDYCNEITSQTSKDVSLNVNLNAKILWPILYRELRRIAARLMSQERGNHTLSPTCLVHEAWLKLGIGDSDTQLIDESHFLSLSARAMRHILVNHAHARHADKRQGEMPHYTLSAAEEIATSHTGPENLLALDQALHALAAEDLRAAHVAEMKVFGGLLIPEIAEALGVSEPTIKRDWIFARARLAQLL